MDRFLGKRSVELNQVQARAVQEPALAPPPPATPQGAARGPQITQVRISNGVESRPGHRLVYLSVLVHTHFLPIVGYWRDDFVLGDVIIAPIVLLSVTVLG